MSFAAAKKTLHGTWLRKPRTRAQRYERAKGGLCHHEHACAQIARLSVGIHATFAKKNERAPKQKREEKRPSSAHTRINSAWHKSCKQSRGQRLRKENKNTQRNRVKTCTHPPTHAARLFEPKEQSTTQTEEGWAMKRERRREGRREKDTRTYIKARGTSPSAPSNTRAEWLPSPPSSLLRQGSSLFRCVSKGVGDQQAVGVGRRF